MPIATPYAAKEAKAPRGFSGGIASLADDQLYALQNAFALDGRVSSYPASARGFCQTTWILLY